MIQLCFAVLFLLSAECNDYYVGNDVNLSISLEISLDFSAPVDCTRNDNHNAIGVLNRGRAKRGEMSCSGTAEQFLC